MGIEPRLLVGSQALYQLSYTLQYSPAGYLVISCTETNAITAADECLPLRGILNVENRGYAPRPLVLQTSASTKLACSPWYSREVTLLLLRCIRPTCLLLYYVSMIVFRFARSYRGEGEFRDPDPYVNSVALCP